MKCFRKFSLSPLPRSATYCEDSDLNPACQHDTGDSNQNHITRGELSKENHSTQPCALECQSEQVQGHPGAQQGAGGYPEFHCHPTPTDSQVQEINK